MRQNYQNDTIAAIATPSGSGGIGIIRISGPASHKILNKVFRPRKKSRYRPFLLRYGQIVAPDKGEILDEVLTVFMPEPNSFTGEDLVEIYCHAGQYSLKTILDNILSVGCRLAEPGEFSLRRFLNHGVDITKLEGAAELVASKTDLAYRLSREHLLGEYGKHINAIRQKIVRLLAEIEADIDFPDEDMLGKHGQEMLQKQLYDLIGQLQGLSEGYKTGKIIKDGYRVVILGPPNAGKSSLFNRLVRQNRALVTPIAGTTRDYISEWVDIDGLPVELFDTAGLRTGRGKIEKAGIEGSRKLINKADLAIYIIDVTTRSHNLKEIQKLKNKSVILALNKIDLVKDPKRHMDSLKLTDITFADKCIISAKTGRGVKKLLSLISQKAGVTDMTDSLVVTSHRHKTKIDKALSHIRKIQKMAEAPVELISFELRQAAEQLSEITGHIYTEDILDEIFSAFCIGK